MKLTRIILLPFFLIIMMSNYVVAEAVHTFTFINKTKEPLKFSNTSQDCISKMTKDVFTVESLSQYVLAVTDRNNMGCWQTEKSFEFNISSPTLLNNSVKFKFEHYVVTYWHSKMTFNFDGVHNYNINKLDLYGNGRKLNSGSEFDSPDGTSATIVFNSPFANPALNANIINLSNYKIPSLESLSIHNNCQLTQNVLPYIPKGGLLSLNFLPPSSYRDTTCGLAVKNINESLESEINFGINTDYDPVTPKVSFIPGANSTGVIPIDNTFTGCINNDPNKINSVVYDYKATPAECRTGCSATKQGNVIMYKYPHPLKSSSPSKLMLGIDKTPLFHRIIDLDIEPKEIIKRTFIGTCTSDAITIKTSALDIEPKDIVTSNGMQVTSCSKGTCIIAPFSFYTTDATINIIKNGIRIAGGGIYLQCTRNPF